VAGGEDQPEAVVGEPRLLLLGFDLLAVGGKPLQPLEDLLLRLQGLLAAKPVHRLVARNPGYPGAGIVRDAVVGPALDRDHERLLDGLLGEVEVTEDPDQARDRPPRLVAEQAVDELLGGLVQELAAACAGEGGDS
jgi:hypothetical protein